MVSPRRRGDGADLRPLDVGGREWGFGDPGRPGSATPTPSGRG